MRTALVTGGSGTIGSAVAREVQLRRGLRINVVNPSLLEDAAKSSKRCFTLSSPLRPAV